MAAQNINRESGLAAYGRYSTRLFQRLILSLIVVPLFLCGDVWAALRSGTEIIIFYTNNKLIIAVDSRATITGEERKYKDDQCKVFQLANKVLFAAAGLVGHDTQDADNSGSWDTYEQAKMIAAEVLSQKKAADDLALETAKRWAERMKGVMEHELFTNLAEAKSAMSESGVVESAVFGGLTASGDISLYKVSLVWDRSDLLWPRTNVEIHKQEPSDRILPLGYLGSSEGLNVFDEVMSGRTGRAKKAKQQWNSVREKLALPEQDAFVTKTVAELIADWAQTTVIGGAIDVVELRKSGEIRWVQRQSRCHDGF